MDDVPASPHGRAMAGELVQWSSNGPIMAKWSQWSSGPVVQMANRGGSRPSGPSSPSSPSSPSNLPASPAGKNHHTSGARNAKLRRPETIRVMAGSSGRLDPGANHFSLASEI